MVRERERAGWFNEYGQVPEHSRTFEQFGERTQARPRFFPRDASRRTSHHSSVDGGQQRNERQRPYGTGWSSEERRCAAAPPARAPIEHEQRAAAPAAWAPPMEQRASSYGGVGRNATEKEEKRSTVMVRNVARKCTQKMLTSDLEEAGFAKQFNFIYLPFCFESKSNVGYAFINFLDGPIAERFIEDWNTKHYDSSRTPIINGKRALTATYADVQGLEANIERLVGDYKIARIHNPRYQPSVFQDGVRVNFQKFTEKFAEKLNVAAKNIATKGNNGKENYKKAVKSNKYSNNYYEPSNVTNNVNNYTYAGSSSSSVREELF